MLTEQGLQTGGTGAGDCRIDDGETDTFTLNTDSKTQCRLVCLDGWYRADSEALPAVSCTANQQSGSEYGSVNYNECTRTCVVWLGAARRNGIVFRIVGLLW